MAVWYQPVVNHCEHCDVESSEATCWICFGEMRPAIRNVADEQWVLNAFQWHPHDRESEELR